MNTASPTNKSLRRPIAELAGPLLNLGVAALAAGFYLKRPKPWLAEVSLAAAMMRLVVYGLVVGAALVTGSGLSLGNDEPIAAQLWHLPSLTFVPIFAVTLAWIVGSIAFNAWNGWRLRTVHLLARAVVMFAVGILIGTVVDPWLFPSR